MNKEGAPGRSAPEPVAEREDNRPGQEDPDLARLIELVERIGGRGEQPV